MSAHAALAPSSSARWTVCAASVRAAQAYPPEDSEDARVGVAAHWLGAECVTRGAWDVRCFWAHVTGEGKGAPMTAPNGVVITEEILDCVQVFVTYVGQLIDQAGNGSQWGAFQVEKQVDLSRVLNVQGQYGTLDFGVWQQVPGATPTLHVVDYKHGFGFVDVVSNTQMELYALGELDEKGYPEVNVVLHIVQPRCYSAEGTTRSWKTSTVHLLKRRDTFYRPAAVKVLAGVECRTSTECRYCPARGSCAALREASVNVYEHVRAFNLDRMAPHNIGVEYKRLSEMIKTFEARRDELEEALYQNVKAGNVCGYTTQSVKGRLAWQAPKEAVVAALKGLGVDPSSSELITPQQVKDRAPKAVKKQVESLVDAMASRGSSLKLVPTDQSLAAKVFLSDTYKG